MNAEMMGCEQVRELAPELALGIAEGDERGAALRHLGGCADCRQLVSELSSVGDELLLLAPAEEPPPGSESRVLGGAKGTWGVQLPVDLSAVHELRLVGPDGRTAFTATFDAAGPWD